VTCREIDELMCTGRGSLMIAPGVVEHLIECGTCRTLMMVLDGAGKSADPDQEHLRLIQTGIVERRGPVRPLAPPRLLLLACAIVFLGIVTMGAMPFAMSGWHARGLAQRFAIFAFLAAGAALLAISIVGQMAPGCRYTLAPARLPVAVLAALLLVIEATFRPRAEAAFLSNGLVCMRTGLT